MLPHHQHTIDRVTEYFRNDPAFPALIIAGSLVKGWGRPDSDVDIMLVATDEEFRRRRESKTLTYFNNQDFCDYEGGYVDGKIIDLEFLQDVAGRGSEPARAAFMGAYLAYSEIPGLDDLLARIPVYPEAEREQKLRSFYAQVQALQWYVGEAEKR
ncbi:MAG: nucleotidyltransferase domain-containing protein, partial [Anaerolineae bacterium]|nr:nucleotidyltransferase domain-containing protein [Anaerolineae bacterium]